MAMYNRTILHSLLLEQIPQDGIIDLGDQGSFYIDLATVRVNVEVLDTEVVGDIYAEGTWKLHDEHNTETPAVYVAFYRWGDHGGWSQVDWDVYEK